jgi:predicted Zn-dependent protease
MNPHTLFTVSSLLFTSCIHNPYMMNKTTGLPLIQCSLPQMVIVASDIPIEHHISIQSAIDYWNTTLGSRVLIFAGTAEEFTSKTEEHYPLIFISQWPDKRSEEPDDRGIEIPYTNEQDTCLIGNRISYFLKRIFGAAQLETIIRHELGHALGLAHNPNKETLMYHEIEDNINETLDIEQREVCALKNIYNLPKKVGECVSNE